MGKIPPQIIKTFQKEILSWYKKNQRDLPWRHTRNPYHILISEVMLQQTQVIRVIPKFESWIQAFPNIEALATAPVPKVLKYWSGLGYNRRALYLKKTAQVLMENYAGEFPKSETALRSLPGIGHYTSRAILCFAFDQQIAVVDTNVRKIILTQFFPHKRQSLNESAFAEIATALLPRGKAYIWNQALMDYASSTLKKERIPIPKQSTFLGSHRYYRGQVLKTLLEKQSVSIENLGTLIKDNYTKEEQPWVQTLVKELEKEGFVIIKNNKVALAS